MKCGVPACGKDRCTLRNGNQRLLCRGRNPARSSSENSCGCSGAANSALPTFASNRSTWAAVAASSVRPARRLEPTRVRHTPPPQTGSRRCAPWRGDRIDRSVHAVLLRTHEIRNTGALSIRRWYRRHFRMSRAMQCPVRTRSTSRTCGAGIDLEARFVLFPRARGGD
jgi:hypothetical protein